MENPANAVKPDASCWAAVKPNPTIAVSGMTQAESVLAITCASSQGVTVSLPGPHSYVSQNTTPANASRCGHVALRKSAAAAFQTDDFGPALIDTGLIDAVLVDIGLIDTGLVEAVRPDFDPVAAMHESTGATSESDAVAPAASCRRAHCRGRRSTVPV